MKLCNESAPSKRDRKRGKLRSGFSTGTAMTAAAMAALRHLLTGRPTRVVAVRLPAGFFHPVVIKESRLENGCVWASVIKDGGDDPDVTHKAEVRVSLRCFLRPIETVCDGTAADSNIKASLSRGGQAGICLIGGRGVGFVTKAGLPVRMGEPAINPVPREMLSVNLSEELARRNRTQFLLTGENRVLSKPAGPHIFIPFANENRCLENIFLELKVEVPKGEELARHTLNPRLGIVGGISILGTTGIVKPFSHKAYEETIETALSVAASNGCASLVLSTGGKSEHYARRVLPDRPVEAFVQIADFFAFSVGEARKMGFKEIIHSVFFGKVVKMAQGHPYTHAHKVPLDLRPVARLAEDQGYDSRFCMELADANTARHALELLTLKRATGVIDAVVRQALEQSHKVAGEKLSVGILLFDYDGNLLADLKSDINREL